MDPTPDKPANTVQVLKKYSCADVEAALADQIAPRAKMRRLSSGAYLSRILREAFEREDELKLADPKALRVIDGNSLVPAASPASPTPPVSPSSPFASLPLESPLDAAIRRAVELAAAEHISKGMRDFLNRKIRSGLE